MPGKQCDDVPENQQLLATRNKKQQQCAISKHNINGSKFSFNNDPIAGQKTNIKSNNFQFGTVTHLLILQSFLETQNMQWWGKQV